MVDLLFKSYKGPKPYVFVSYARKDKEQVFPVLNAMHKNGCRIWLDEGGIPLSEEWMKTIQDHLDRSAVCLVFWSAASADSQHCRAETGEMVAEKKKIITIHLDDTPVTSGLRMYLRQFQSVKRANYDSDAAFAEFLGQQEILAPCKEYRERWHREGQLQWKLNTKGVLTITRIEKYDCYSCMMLDYADTWNETEEQFIGSSAPWMKSRENILDVVIQEGISSIGDRAFQDCSSLTSVAIPNSVTLIGEGAFWYCSALTSVIIPDSVTTIDNFAFAGCSSLKSLAIPNNVTLIGDSTFEDCLGLTSVTIPNSVTSIGDSAFFLCSALTSVTIPDSITTIDNFAFRECSSLASVEIPESVTTIGHGAFWDCKSLKRVEIPAGATYVESGFLSSFPPDTQIIRRPPPKAQSIPSGVHKPRHPIHRKKGKA